MGKASREKGKRGEREWRDMLISAGFTDARRGVQHQGGIDSPDVKCDSMPGFHAEVKRTETLSVYEAMRQAKADAGPRQVPYVAHRRSEQNWLVITEGLAWLDLVRDALAWRKHIEGRTFSAPPNTPQD